MAARRGGGGGGDRGSGGGCGGGERELVRERLLCFVRSHFSQLRPRSLVFCNNNGQQYWGISALGSRPSAILAFSRARGVLID